MRRSPFFNKLPQGECRYWPTNRLAPFADVAQQAERGHAMAEATSSKLVIRSTSAVSLHSEAARHGVAARDVRDPGPATCSETPRPTGRSRSGTAEVDLFALVAQQAEQPPCKR